MAKILFKHPSGEQMLVDVGIGGGIACDCEVLWDERLHGPMPEIELGKMQAYDERLNVQDADGNVIVERSTRKLRLLETYLESHANAINQRSQSEINKEAQKYLASTDWYILREMDSGVACPIEIKQARQAARDRIG